MTIHVRSYIDDDLNDLQNALAGWIQEAGDCGYYHPGNIAHRIYEGFGDKQSHQELVRVWEEDSTIIGFAYNFVFDVAFFVFVCPKYRGSDVELEILRSAYATTQCYVVATNRDDQAVITDVYDCDQTRINLLTQLGFEQYRLWDYITERSLANPIAEPVVPAGFTIRSATMDEAEQLAAIRNNSFGGSWTAAVYRAQVMQSPNYRSEREIVVVAPDGRFAAFTVIRFDGLNNVGLFEPVGTHNDFRRMGLARALLLHGMRVMEHHGMRWATVEHTADNVAARELYRNLGFVKKYETLGFQHV